MSIIRHGDLHRRVHHAEHSEWSRGIGFIELFIVIGIVATLGIAIYVAAETDRQVMQARQVTRVIRR